jgi:hypothetical protein
VTSVCPQICVSVIVLLPAVWDANTFAYVGYRVSATLNLFKNAEVLEESHKIKAMLDNTGTITTVKSVWWVFPARGTKDIELH